MANETTQDRLLVADAAESAGNPISEPAEAGEADAAQFDILQVVPEAIDRIELGYVARQALQLEPGSSAAP